ncbi:MAG TPA: hypothetical protein VFE74_06045 [Ramlibacter sp.]|nr:hypothetical protein [Ramlibacter sp.]
MPHTQAAWKVDATGVAPRKFQGPQPSWRGRCRQGPALRNTDTEYKVRELVQLRTDQSETTVLLVFLLAFWRWLLPAPAVQAPWFLFGVLPAAAFALQRRRHLALIPLPLRRLLS